MNATKRRHYRVTGEDLNGINICLMVGSEPQPVHLIDISAAGAAIAFLDAKQSDVESLVRSTREAPVVRIESSRLQESLNITCRVAHVQEVAAGVVCGVAFLRRVDETFNLDRALLRVFNRRGAVRVEPDPKSPIDVRLSTPSGAVLASGTMRDMSLTGIGVAVAPADMSAVPAGTHLVARFTVDNETLVLRAQVRFGKTSTSTPSGDAPPTTIGLLGIEFEPDERNNPTNRKRIANWVMGRQLEIQRIQREAAASDAYA